MFTKLMCSWKVSTTWNMAVWLTEVKKYILFQIFSQIFSLISFYYFGSVENIEEHRDIFKIVPPTIKISSSNINSTDGAFRLPTTCDNPLVRPTYSSE